MFTMSCLETSGKTFQLQQQDSSGAWNRLQVPHYQILITLSMGDHSETEEEKHPSKKCSTPKEALLSLNASVLFAYCFFSECERDEF